MSSTRRRREKEGVGDVPFETRGCRRWLRCSFPDPRPEVSKGKHPYQLRGTVSVIGLVLSSLLDQRRRRETARRFGVDQSNVALELARKKRSRLTRRDATM